MKNVTSKLVYGYDGLSLSFSICSLCPIFSVALHELNNTTCQCIIIIQK